MADSGGHWTNLAALQKLTESTKVPGVIETDVMRGNPAERMALVQAAHTGKSIKWLREQIVADADVTDIQVGEILTFSENMGYDEEETELKISYIMRKLDKYVRDIYGTFNDYRAQILVEMEKALLRKLGDKILYNDLTYGGAKQFDGLHALAAVQTGTDLDIDGGEAGFSFGNLRTLVDAMPAGVDELWFPHKIMRQVDAAYQEKGFSGLAITRGTMASMSIGWNEAGKRQMFWDGIPIVRTDYLVAEQANTGVGSDARAKYSSGDKQYSIMAVKFGNVLAEEPGMALAFGNTEGNGQFYKLDTFPTLENWDAEAMRMVSYVAVLLGAAHCLGRIYDIEDLPVTA